MQSFVHIHEECKPALPERMILYKHAIMLHKIYNIELPEFEWMALNFQQLLTSRQANFSYHKNKQKESW